MSCSVFAKFKSLLKGFTIKFSPQLFSAVFSPQSSNLNHLTSADTPPAATSTLPPPLPVKSRDTRPQDSLSPNQCRPAKSPCDSPPPLTRSSTARVSFREPISSSYSLDEDEDDKEEELQHVSSNQQDRDEGAEEEEGGALGKRLHLQKGIPPQMDLLGEEELQSVESV